MYAKRHPRSHEAFRRAQRVTPGGLSHNIRYFPPYPFFATSASGARVRDLDGNEYLDFWMGHYALILGHAHPAVSRVLRDQLDGGVHWGIANPWQVELAERVVADVPCAEQVRFCNSGAEATMYAARLARGATGHRRILKAEGGWHGFCTDLLRAVHPPWDAAESRGLPPDLDEAVTTFPFNDPEAAAEAIQSADDLAAVIVEPVLGAGGAVPAEEGFLRTLQEEARARDALLIFDEVITGFRLSLGGAQSLYGVEPDLVTLGKILGGGLPVGAVAGRADLLERTNPRGDRGGVVVGGGTFSCNPLTMRAGLATLTYLEEHPGLYADLDRRGNRIRREGAKAFEAAGLPTAATGLGSLFQFHLLREAGATIRSAADVRRFVDRERAEEELKVRLVNEGVYTMHGGGCVSLPHTDEDVAALLEAVRRVARGMAEDGA